MGLYATANQYNVLSSMTMKDVQNLMFFQTMSFDLYYIPGCKLYQEVQGLYNMVLCPSNACLKEVIYMSQLYSGTQNE